MRHVTYECSDNQYPCSFPFLPLLSLTRLPSFHSLARCLFFFSFLSRFLSFSFTIFLHQLILSPAPVTNSLALISLDRSLALPLSNFLDLLILSLAHLQCHLPCCSVLQCVAVCCSVLQCVAVCCSVFQCAAVCYSDLQCAAVCCSVLQCVAVLGSVWQCLAVCCSVLQCVAVCCSVLQCVAVCCSVPQYIAVCHSVSTWVAI